MTGVVAKIVRSVSGRKTNVECRVGAAAQVLRGGGAVPTSVKKLRICVSESVIFVKGGVLYGAVLNIL
jgi:hypothetical protein